MYNSLEGIVLIGLTGQSGAGKTTVSKIFGEGGFAVIDADKIARKVVEVGTPCCEKIKEIFPECFEDCILDRKKLGGIVFNDKNKLELLNKTIFPFIITASLTEIREFKAKGIKYVLLDAPTLFESKMDLLCDFVVSVVASHEKKIARIMERDNLTLQSAENRVSSQKSEGFYRENSSFVIENNEDISLLKAKVEKIINIIFSEN